MPLCYGTHLIARAKQKRLGDQRFVAMEITYEGWNFNSGNYLFITDTK